MGEMMDMGFLAGLGWGCAFGLGVALAVALWPERRERSDIPRPPQERAKAPAPVDFTQFGERRA